MKHAEKFRGTGVALVTPFRDSGSLDEDALRRFVEWQVEQGTDFLVPCGTTGENPSLTRAEHLRVVEITIEAAAGKVPVLAGAGSNSTETAIDFALAVIDLGADGILTITPYYNKPSPDGLLRHFSSQAEAVEKKSSGFPMIVYNVPGRTGCNIDPVTLERIGEAIPNVVGIKEASADLDQIMQMIRRRKEGFLILSGDDSWTLPLIALGGDGVVSVAANEVPDRMSKMVSAAMAGDLETARAIHYEILPLMEGNFIESNPAPAKAALKMMGIFESDFVRSPLSPIRDESREKLRSILSTCEIDLNERRS
ncbi:MAG: 4-hydroxy-tetrahydrodipicolinate synthase [Thermoanaerobaculia bacterium]|nr:4-hydroxy-tetrahydrodipicolinate synthase [Thermoanaerobaculia bacterium]